MNYEEYQKEKKRITNELRYLDLAQTALWKVWAVAVVSWTASVLYVYALYGSAILEIGLGRMMLLSSPPVAFFTIMAIWLWWPRKNEIKEGGKKQE